VPSVKPAVVCTPITARSCSSPRVRAPAYVAALRGTGNNPQVRITGTGTHWWNFWEEHLHDAWFTTFAPALGQ